MGAPYILYIYDMLRNWSTFSNYRPAQTKNFYFIYSSIYQCTEPCRSKIVKSPTDLLTYADLQSIMPSTFVFQNHVLYLLILHKVHTQTIRPFQEKMCACAMNRTPNQDLHVYTAGVLLQSSSYI